MMSCRTQKRIFCRGWPMWLMEIPWESRSFIQERSMRYEVYAKHPMACVSSKWDGRKVIHHPHVYNDEALHFEDADEIVASPTKHGMVRASCLATTWWTSFQAGPMRYLQHIQPLNVWHRAVSWVSPHSLTGRLCAAMPNLSLKQSEKIGTGFESQSSDRILSTSQR